MGIFTTALAEAGDLSTALEGLTNEEAAVAGGVVGAILGASAVIIIIWLVLQIIADWKIFTKAGEAGWKSIIPVYNYYTEYFASMPDETLALKAHKIDAIFINNALIDFAASHNPELVKMSEHYLDSSFGFAFPKGDPQRDVWGAVIDRMKADGTIDALWEKWMLSDETDKKVPQQDWPGNAGTVRVACADSFEPMSYVGKNKEMMGFDVEILLNVARELDLERIPDRRPR